METFPGQRIPTPSLIRSYRESGLWGDESVTTLLSRLAERRGGDTAIVDRSGRITFGQLQADAARAAAALREHGVQPRDRFVIQLPNWHEAVVLHLALSRLGAITVNLPVTYRRAELEAILRITRATGIALCADTRRKDLLDVVTEMRGSLPWCSSYILVGGEPRRGMVTYGDLLSSTALDPAEPMDLDPTWVTVVSFTSGTTGDPKGIMHTTGTLGSINASMAASYDLGPDDVIFMGAPIGHSIGFYHGVRMSIFLGAKLVFLDEWDPRRARQLIEQEDATYTTLAVPHLYDLLQDMDGFRGRLRYILCGGSPVSERLMREARARLPRVMTTRLWGMTEGIGTACRPGTPQEKLFTTDGRPFPGTELRLLSPDLEDVAVGETGHLAMRGPHLFNGYFERPDLNEDLFLPDGFFLTGDLATQDEDGFVTIVGREKDIIIRGGVNIAPASLERVLAEEPNIAHVAVVGSPDPRLGERICAVVVPREGETVQLADLVARASSAGLTKQSWPERLVIASELPMTPSGKVQKGRLRELIAELSADVNVTAAPWG